MSLNSHASKSSCPTRPSLNSTSAASCSMTDPQTQDPSTKAWTHDLLNTLKDTLSKSQDIQGDYGQLMYGTCTSVLNEVANRTYSSSSPATVSSIPSISQSEQSFGSLTDNGRSDRSKRPEDNSVGNETLTQVLSAWDELGREAWEDVQEEENRQAGISHLDPRETTADLHSACIVRDLIAHAQETFLSTIPAFMESGGSLLKELRGDDRKASIP